MEHGGACNHLADHPQLEILWALDAYLHMTDAYAKCTHCDAHYLVEMIDIKNGEAAFRAARLPSEYVAKTVHSLRKGSCDINRARDETFALRNSAQALPLLLIMSQGEFDKTVPVEQGLQIPQASWRDLPCDGTWLAYANAHTD
jgi:hypothetical protein